MSKIFLKKYFDYAKLPIMNLGFLFPKSSLSLVQKKQEQKKLFKLFFSVVFKISED